MSENHIKIRRSDLEKDPANLTVSLFHVPSQEGREKMSDENVTVKRSDLMEILRRLESLENSIQQAGQPPSSEKRSP